MIKTIGDLRELIREHEGSLQIGSFEIRTEDGKDIDFLYKGNLFQWISNTHEDEEEISDHTNRMDAQIVDNISKETIKEVEKIVEVERVDQKQIGMIEAYEKLLIGRKVTLE